MDAVSAQKQSLWFLQDNFRRFYQTHPIELPDRFSRREYAFVFFGGKGMLRHLSFPRKQPFQGFLIDKAPMHAYYSTAYYQRPDAPTMQEKGWMGAELIFDLDADHLPNVETIPYEKQLELVKKEFIKLVDDFLMKDFGFEEHHLELYFSGGRGYHCHVKDPRVFQLDSGERREIVDYIIGRDLRDNLVFQDHTTERKQYGSRSFSGGTTLRMPAPTEPGWKGRISRGLIEIIEEITNSEDPITKLEEYGVEKQTAEKLLEDLSEERIQRIKKGQLDQSKTIRKFFLNNALRKTAVSFASGETDEPVTCDVKRLIRLPGSLHGKTGFQVTKVTLDSLKDFDPLTDAVVFQDELVSVEVIKETTIQLKQETYRLETGHHTIPLYVAVFCLARRICVLSG